MINSVLTDTDAPLLGVVRRIEAVERRDNLLLPSGGSWVPVDQWVQQRIHELSAAVDARSTAIERSVGTLDQHVGSLGSRATSLETTTATQDAHIGSLGSRATRLETRMGAVEGRANGAHSRVDSLSSAVDGMAATINGLASALDLLRRRFESHRSHPPGAGTAA